MLANICTNTVSSMSVKCAIYRMVRNMIGLGIVHARIYLPIMQYNMGVQVTSIIAINYDACICISIYICVCCDLVFNHCYSTMHTDQSAQWTIDHCTLGRILLRFGSNVFLIETIHTVPFAINQPHRIQTKMLPFAQSNMHANIQLRTYPEIQIPNKV